MCSPRERHAFMSKKRKTQCFCSSPGKFHFFTVVVDYDDDTHHHHHHHRRKGSILIRLVP